MPTPERPCPTCKGTGKIMVKAMSLAASGTAPGDIKTVQREHLCPSCHGSKCKGLATKGA